MNFLSVAVAGIPCSFTHGEAAGEFGGCGNGTSVKICYRDDGDLHRENNIFIIESSYIPKNADSVSIFAKNRIYQTKLA